MSEDGWDPVERPTALLDATAPWFTFSIDPKAVPTEELALTPPRRVGVIEPETTVRRSTA